MTPPGSGTLGRHTEGSQAAEGVGGLEGVGVKVTAHAL